MDREATNHEMATLCNGIPEGKVSSEMHIYIVVPFHGRRLKEFHQV